MTRRRKRPTVVHHTWDHMMGVLARYAWHHGRCLCFGGDRFRATNPLSKRTKRK